MANRLAMAKVHGIQQLAQQGWSRRRIAEALGVDRRTVARYLDGEGSKGTAAPTGSERPASDSKCTTAPTGSAVQQEAGGASTRSACEAYRETILAKLNAGLSARRIHQDLISDHDFTGSYWSVVRYVRKLGAKSPVPFRRMEVAPGAEAQVDFGTGVAIVTADGKRRKTYVLRVVLSHSRKAYSEAVYRQTTDAFLTALENAFWHFGGVPETVVIDNLKAAVHKADWYDPELHPKIGSFAAHYGTTILPTKPYTPRHKGKVERGVDYVQENALKGKAFSTLEAQNEHLREWERTVADTRIHGTTKRQVAQQFHQSERPALRPLPPEHFASFQEAERKVNRDGHVEVDKAYYSAPPEYLGRTVWVRWDSRLVRLFNHRFEQVAVHVKGPPGRFSTDAGHIVPEKRAGVERGTTELLKKVSVIGPHATEWAEHMLKTRGIEGVRVLMGLVALSGKNDLDALEGACETAVGYGCYHLRTIRELVKRKAPPLKQQSFLEEHPIIRSLSDYDQVVRDAFVGAIS